jgi:hypothetical protein
MTARFTASRTDLLDFAIYCRCLGYEIPARRRKNKKDLSTTGKKTE